MKSKINKKENAAREVEVTLDQKEFEPYWRNAYDAAASKVALKGFRPGAAPKELVDRAVDHDKIFEEALREAVRHSLSELAEEQNWTLIDQPNVEVTEGSEKGVTYKATLTIFPEIKLADYKKIAAHVLKEKKAVVISEEEREKTLQYLLDSRAALTRVERPAKKGDLVEVNVHTQVAGKEVPGGELRAERFVLGESHLIKGFDDQLAGKKEKEQFSFSLTAPSDYWQTEYQGKQFDFTGEMLGVYERAVPELTDTFAQSLGPNFKTVQDLKQSIEEGMRQEKEQKEQERIRIKILDAIVKESKIELPEIMVSRTLESMLKDAKQMMGSAPGQKPEEMEAEMRKQFMPRAQQNVASNLALYKIAQEEKLAPSGEDVDAEAKRHNIDPQEHYDYIYGKLQNQKVFELLESQEQK